MLASNFLFLLVPSVFSGFATSSPVSESLSVIAPRGNADVLSVLNTLKGQTDNILPQFSTRLPLAIFFQL